MTSLPGSLLRLKGARLVEDVDLQLAGLVMRMDPGADESVLLAAALASREVRCGHVCLELGLGRVPALAEFPPEGSLVLGPLPDLPAPEAWIDSLRRATGAVQVAPAKAAGSARSPLVLDAERGRLYLGRYWQYERDVAEGLRLRARACESPVWPENLGGRLAELFPGAGSEGVERQRLAAFAALRNRLTVITGGPGTGKTYTVARILALLLQAHADPERPLAVWLVAPTGKASMRLVESIREARDGLTVKDAVKARIPDSAATIDRMLGRIASSPYFRHDAGDPLEADLVIVDEASMVDLPKMAKLLDALRPEARLILLGDMNQLASVEPGCVLGEICRASRPNVFPPSMRRDFVERTGMALEDPGLRWDGADGLGGCVIELTCSRRFLPDGPVARLSEAVRLADSAGLAERAWDELVDNGKAAAPVRRFELGDSLTDEEGRPLPDFAASVAEGYAGFLAAETPDDAFAALRRFRVLCALRRGPCGVERVNPLVERVLAEAAAGSAHSFRAKGRFYHKRVIMITRNEYSLRLFNGDIGVVFADAVAGGAASRRTEVYFQQQGADGAAGLRRLPANMLPEHETAFAMTVHKSQGSEFGKVLVILPPKDTPVLTRELIYTAITRTRHTVDLWCSEETFKAAALRKTERASGLYEALKTGAG